ncbi:MAG TPA: hypothetical protein VFX63_17515 [Pyrinomonadaceae bacterium]|nr:hypothetical protein [Pyrinomonadaceae bacterium]
MSSRLPYSLLLLVLSLSCVYAQETKDKKKDEAPQQLTIVLATGNTLLVDEISESSDGYWYKRGNITTFLDRDRVTRIEHPKPEGEAATSAPAREGKWTLAEATKVEQFFLSKFKRPLPVSAFGQSDLHTRWGWDHRNGMDVGLHPDSVEGRALIEFLRAESIPFLVFRGPVPGVATGPHIHVGNRSSRSYGR